MKLEKGYTYPQFIKHVDKECGDDKQDAIECWSLIWDFSEVCNKPLSEDMFTHSVLHPDKCTFRKDYIDQIGFEMDYAAQLMCWQEVEKKVIFKGFRSRINDDEILNLDHKAIEIFVEYNKVDNTWEYCIPSKEDWIKTIGDLFAATCGELELQNLDL
jgi:hypothetical protein